MTRTFLLLSILVGTSACNTSRHIIPPIPIDEKDLIGDYAILDKLPKLIGGIGMLMEHVNPRACRADGETIVEFIVDENGNVLEPSITQSTSRGCDAEIIRLITKHAKFTPGLHADGHAVKVKMSLPITVRSL